jgi:hypothetical protein
LTAKKGRKFVVAAPLNESKGITGATNAVKILAQKWGFVHAGNDAKPGGNIQVTTVL